ncbi:hypothetical protein K469DRAFT_715500 [Zopfia rhizophila CBS 207.26]|uniref:Uncharacterized protein n=1 Tax=Zopfia rhizophila CBS 207.26 TaxID=1314779 RepID=A0A6A6DQN9_9PEZI|nr:hypothetical protein K469DRAFT_715500 [Zopfia rhizophila CBS 207.26]
MAFSTGIGDRSDDLRFRNAQSPRDESSFPSPLRNVGSQMQAHNSASSDARGHLHRRFTTNNIPTLNTPLSPIGQQRRQAAEPTEYTTATYHKLQVVRAIVSLSPLLCTVPHLLQYRYSDKSELVRLPAKT